MDLRRDLAHELAVAEGRIELQPVAEGAVREGGQQVARSARGDAQGDGVDGLLGAGGAHVAEDEPELREATQAMEVAEGEGLERLNRDKAAGDRLDA